MNYNPAPISFSRENYQKKVNQQHFRDNSIYKQTGLQKTNLAYHVSPEQSIMHDVYMKHDKYGYHYFYIPTNIIYVIARNKKHPFTKTTLLGEATLFSKIDDPRKGSKNRF